MLHYLNRNAFEADKTKLLQELAAGTLTLYDWLAAFNKMPDYDTLPSMGVMTVIERPALLLQSGIWEQWTRDALTALGDLGDVARLSPRAERSADEPPVDELTRRLVLVRTVLLHFGFEACQGWSSYMVRQDTSTVRHLADIIVRQLQLGSIRDVQYFLGWGSSSHLEADAAKLRSHCDGRLTAPMRVCATRAPVEFLVTASRRYNNLLPDSLYVLAAKMLRDTGRLSEFNMPLPLPPAAAEIIRAGNAS